MRRRGNAEKQSSLRWAEKSQEQENGGVKPPLQREKILQELLAGVGEDGFGVELDAFDGVLAVAETHDDSVIGLSGDRKAARKSAAFDDQRMVARGGEGVRELAKDIFVVVMDLAGFAVEKFRSTYDFPAEGNANGLMAQADSQDGKFSG